MWPRPRASREPARSATLRRVFDLRYHVASLTAVFLALVIGILVGIGLSGRGFVDDAERTRLNQDIADLKAERNQARTRLDAVSLRLAALDDYAADSYPQLVKGRLAGKRVAVLYVGSVDQTVDFSVDQVVRDAGGRVVRVRALRIPMNEKGIQSSVLRTVALRGYGGPGHLDDLGRDLGRELTAGGKTPLWDALSDVLVEERVGSASVASDAIVVARSVPPQRGSTKSFLGGLYAGIASSNVPAVGVAETAAEVSAVPVFTRAGLSTVDSVDTPAGRLALALLLAGAKPGHYGVDETATDGILPPIEPVETPAG